MIHIDDLIKNGETDHTAAFLKAAEYDEIVLSRRDYVMNGQINIKTNQVWHMNGAKVKHTDNSKIIFKAEQVEGWAILGSGILEGTLTARGSALETGLQIIGCNRYRVEGLTAQLFLGRGIHIKPGSLMRYKSDQGRFTDCAVYECMTGLEVEADTGAEYNLFSNFHAVGNIIGAKVAAGNTVIVGGNISENADGGLMLQGGVNNGHGILSAIQFNHNSGFTLQCDNVTWGFTIADSHFYNNGGGGSPIIFNGSTTDVCIDGGLVDCPIIHNASGTNRVQNVKKQAQFGVSGSNAAGLIQANNY